MLDSSDIKDLNRAFSGHLSILGLLLHLLRFITMGLHLQPYETTVEIRMKFFMFGQASNQVFNLNKTSNKQTLIYSMKRKKSKHEILLMNVLIVYDVKGIKMK